MEKLIAQKSTCFDFISSLRSFYLFVVLADVASFLILNTFWFLLLSPMSLFKSS